MPIETKHLDNTNRDVERVYQVGTVLHLDCYRDSYARIAWAASQGRGRLLPPWNHTTRFCRMWGNLIGKDGAWATFPQAFRGMGAPGALAMRGWSPIIRGPQVWAGALRPGAVLQAWASPHFLSAVRDGRKPPLLLGHSFVFIAYEYAGRAIVGLHVADNGYHGNRVVHRHKWPVLIGANTV